MIRPTPLATLSAGLLLVIAVLIATLAASLWLAWLGLFLLLIIALVADFVFMDQTSELPVRVESPAQLSTGSENPIPFQLVRAPRSRVHRLSLRLRSSGLPAQSEALAVDFKGGLRATGELSLKPLRRGLLKILGVEATWSGPLGLLERRALLAGDAIEVPCVPDLVSLRQAALAWSQTRQPPEGVKILRLVGDGTEFDALREYQQGHDHRAIDWRTSARMRSLHVREYRDEKNHQVVLAVDAGRHMQEEQEGHARVDLALNASMLIAHSALVGGDRVTLFAFDRVPRVQSPTIQRVQHFSQLVNAAARVPYSQEATNWHASLGAIAQKLRRRSIVVLFTSLDDAISADALANALPFLTRRHFVIVAALHEGTNDLATHAIQTNADIQEVALQDEIRRQRELAIRTLQQRGARVVEGDNQQLARKILQHYGEAKRRGLV